MDKIEIGQIVKCIGLKGLLKVNPLTNDVERFKNLKEIYIEGYDNPFVLESSKPAGTTATIKIKGFDKIEDVEKFKNKYISVSMENAIKLKEGEYFIQDLIGCEVYYYDGSMIGKIVDVDNFGANDILYIKNKTTETPVAFIEGIFEKVDIPNKKIYVTKKFDEVYLSCE